jgi:hypothetical protein
MVPSIATFLQRFSGGSADLSGILTGFAEASQARTVVGRGLQPASDPVITQATGVWKSRCSCCTMSSEWEGLVVRRW